MTNERMIDPADLSLGAPQISYTQLCTLAKRHRAVLFSVLLTLLHLGLMLEFLVITLDATDYSEAQIELIEWVFFGIKMAITAFSIYAVFRLASLIVLQQASGVLFSMLMFVPFANLIALIYLDRRAVRILRRYGLSVGLLGVNWKSI